MELERRSSPRRNTRRLLGAILIGIGILAVIAQMAVAVVVMPSTLYRANRVEYAPGVRVNPGIPAMPEMPAMPAMPEIPSIAEPTVTVNTGIWGGFGLLAAMLKAGMVLAAFAVLGLGAYLLVRAANRSRAEVPATPATGPQADHARDA